MFSVICGAEITHTLVYHKHICICVHTYIHMNIYTINTHMFTHHIHRNTYIHACTHIHSI